MHSSCSGKCSRRSSTNYTSYSCFARALPLRYHSTHPKTRSSLPAEESLRISEVSVSVMVSVMVMAVVLPHILAVFSFSPIPQFTYSERQARQTRHNFAACRTNDENSNDYCAITYACTNARQKNTCGPHHYLICFIGFISIFPSNWAVPSSADIVLLQPYFFLFLFFFLPRTTLPSLLIRAQPASQTVVVFIFS